MKVYPAGRIVAILIGALLLVVTGCTEPPTPTYPNILIIMADDLGYGDLGVYNSKSLVPTPNLDKLAAEGIRFTNAYCPASVCSPTRYSLMTGNYPWRGWRKTGVMRNYEPSMMDSDILTLPEILKQAGYITTGFGKWHLGTTFPTIDGGKPGGFGKFYAEDNGANIDFSKPVSDGPMDHGFDHWLGFSCASECWILKDRNITAALQHDLYTTEAANARPDINKIPLTDYLSFITEQTKEFLRNTSGHNLTEPFFLYFAPYVPHIPLAVSDGFRGKTKAGLYGDYVHQLDHRIGELLQVLDELGLTENTMVLFMSDNGSQFTATNSSMNLEDAGNSPSDSLPVVYDQDTHYPNAPLRGTKWTALEGGVRTPLIARWPGVFPKNHSSQQMISLMDITKSVASLVQVELPPETAVDALDMLPAFYGREGPRNSIIVQSSGRRIAIRKDHWKYICSVDFDDRELSFAEEGLYDLSADESELQNKVSAFPGKVQELRKDLQGELFGGEQESEENLSLAPK